MGNSVSSAVNSATSTITSGVNSAASDVSNGINSATRGASSIGNEAASDISSGVNTAIKGASSIGSGGSLLPWNDWLYHVNDLKSEVQQLHTQAVQAQDNIRAQVPRYNVLLDQTRQLVAGNAALVIISRAVKFNDLQLRDFEVQLKALPDPPKGCVPLQFGMFLSEVTGSFLVLKAVVNLAKIAKSGLFPSVPGDAMEGLAETGLEVDVEGGAEAGAEAGVEAGIEAGAELATEAGAEAALSSTGIGIIAAVGIDAILGAINGAQERDQLDDQISKLNDAINKLNTFQNELDKNFTKLYTLAAQEQARFRAVVTALQQVIPYKSFDRWMTLPGGPKATGRFLSPMSASIGQYLVAQMQALTYYGLLAQLRVTFLRAKERAPSASKAAIIAAVLFSAKADVTSADLYALWDILARYSDDMKGLNVS